MMGATVAQRGWLLESAGRAAALLVAHDEPHGRSENRRQHDDRQPRDELALRALGASEAQERRDHERHGSETDEPGQQDDNRGWEHVVLPSSGRSLPTVG